MSTAVMPQNAMYEFGDIIIKVGVVFAVRFVCRVYYSQPVATTIHDRDTVQQVESTTLPDPTAKFLIKKKVPQVTSSHKNRV